MIPEFTTGAPLFGDNDMIMTRYQPFELHHSIQYDATSDIRDFIGEIGSLLD